jgi:hypothetical protein
LSLDKLLKTHREKMSVFRLSTMLMKTSELKQSLHDVNEKKGVTEDECEVWQAASAKQKAKSECKKTAEPTDNPPARHPLPRIGYRQDRAEG